MKCLFRLSMNLITSICILLFLAAIASADVNAADNIMVSSSSDRSSPAKLDGQSVGNEIYVFVQAGSIPKKVLFYVDDPARSKAPFRTDYSAPFDLAGSTSSDAIAKPFNTKTLSNGQHVITAALVFSDGTVKVISGSFVKGSQQPPQPPQPPEPPQPPQPPQPPEPPQPPQDQKFSLMLSSSPDRSNPAKLDGQKVGSEIFVFISPEAGIRSVSFYIDDPGRTKAPYKTENLPAFDLAGTKSPDGLALPFKTNTLQVGQHTITAAITLSNDSVYTISGIFNVDSQPQPPPPPQSVAVSQLGFHPKSHKQVVVYTNVQGGSFEIVNAATGLAEYSGTLDKAKNHDGENAACQGNLPCLIGEFTGLAKEGTYYARTNSGPASREFKISSNIFADTMPLFLEPFNAWLQQGSAYHEDMFKFVNPPFPITADGSLLMRADMAGLTLIRLGSAYNHNPRIFLIDKYRITQDNLPDIAEHMKKYVDYLTMLQDYEKTLAVSEGWRNTFKCPWDIRPDESKYNDVPQPCMYFVNDTSNYYTALTLLAFLQAIPAIHHIDGIEKAEKLLDRSIATEAYLRNKQLDSSSAGFYSASLFFLYDYTGSDDYLKLAHAARNIASTKLDSHQTFGNEYYWEEYVRHKDDILSLGLEYAHNNKNPEDYFKEKLLQDWIGKNSEHSISNNGERLFQYDNNIQFQNSRTMLAEAVIAAKANELLNNPDSFIQTIADSQIAWLTGMNLVEEGAGAGPRSSRSFIFGIGNFPKAFHSIFAPPEFFKSGSTMTFKNGMKYIPGWVNGAYDSEEDNNRIWNYVDNQGAWRFTETTNEIVASAIELFSIFDAQYNNKEPVVRPKISRDVSIPEDDFDDDRFATPELMISSSPDRSNAVKLDGNEVSNEFYVFVHPNTNVGKVSFYIDDPLMKNTPYRVEVTPFDLGGTSLNGMALPFKANTLPAGHHIVTASAMLFDGSLITLNGVFTILNSPLNPGKDLQLSIAPWYPKGTHYIFVCSANGYATSEYWWTFGDGQTQSTQSDHVYHIYDSPGDYIASCSAKGKSDESFSDILALIAGEDGDGSDDNGGSNDNGDEDENQDNEDESETEPDEDEEGDNGSLEMETDFSIADWYPKGTHYIFVCSAKGFVPYEYMWEFGDGHVQTTPENNVYHIYEPGSYTASCSAKSELFQIFSEKLSLIAAQEGQNENSEGDSEDDNSLEDSETSHLSSIPVKCADKDTNEPCSKLSDIDEGSCRMVSYAEPGKNLEAMSSKICEKQDGTLEVYMEHYNSVSNLEICFNDLCVDRDWGYRSSAD